MTWSHWQAWQKYRVTDVRSIEEFMLRYYKPDRYHGRGDEYAAVLLRSHTMDLLTYGVDWISHHDSVTGCVVAFYAPVPTVLTLLEHAALDVLLKHPDGLLPRSIMLRAGGMCNRTWWEVRDRLEAAGRIRCATLPDYGGNFRWYAIPTA